MQRFSLATLAGSRRRPSVTLPPVEDSIGARKEYERILRQMLRAISEEVKVSVIPAVSVEIDRVKAELTQDGLGEQIFDAVKRLAVDLGIIAERMVNRVLSLESDRHTKKWKASVRRALGIDLEAVVRQEDLVDFLQTAAARNASLIESLGDDVVKRIEQASYRAVTQGQTVAQYRKVLTEEFGIVGRRADLIAQDQISKLTSDLNKQRHMQAGIEEYVWSSSRDERVRPLHRALNGREYRYGEPTGAEQGLPPGQPIRCRCVARAIVRFDGERF